MDDTKIPVNQKKREFEIVLDNLIESVAVLIVTTCVILLADMIPILWLVKRIIVLVTEYKAPSIKNCKWKKKIVNAQNKVD